MTMGGYFSSLTKEQQAAALSYRGPENHGDMIANAIIAGFGAAESLEREAILYQDQARWAAGIARTRAAAAQAIRSSVAAMETTHGEDVKRKEG